VQSPWAAQVRAPHPAHARERQHAGRPEALLRHATSAMVIGCVILLLYNTSSHSLLLVLLRSAIVLIIPGGTSYDSWALKALLRYATSALVLGCVLLLLYY